MKLDKLKEALQITKLLSDDSSEDGCVCPNGELRIVILQRGWVFIGKYYKEGTQCELHNPYCIRQWGTTNGLGQLALEGPTDSTKLEPSPTVKFHELTEVASMVCEAKKWSKYYK